ncbi:DUF3489 domain-containing protein [Roseomonas sp. HF4]|uniref:DUF3489 domain-containing protein n=1 Tax=Roseomonas sp. HF4 TaxID=2562313 RepID=UPI0010BF9A32|nr:DUF3489 domain-containing protein [Roseomonas sp. HF4]
MTKREANQLDSLEVFLMKKAEFDELLAELQQASAEHFGADPEAVLWGDGPMEALRAALAGKSARAARAPGAPRKPRDGTRQEAVLALLRRPEGATVALVAEATGWAQPTVRWFFAGLKKEGIEITVLEQVRQVRRNKDGARGSYSVYTIAD